MPLQAQRSYDDLAALMREEWASEQDDLRTEAAREKMSQRQRERRERERAAREPEVLMASWQSAGDTFDLGVI